MIITRTPLRVSFVGGGTDIPCYYERNGGAVLSCAINRYIYVTANWRDDDQIVCSYSHIEKADKANWHTIQHALINACIRRVWLGEAPKKGIEIHLIGELSTIGTGLGGSSAVTVGLLNALYHLKGAPIARQEDLADAACIVEMNILRKPIGKQDQYACALGGMNVIKFNSDHSVEFDRLKPRIPVVMSLIPAISTKAPRDCELLLSNQNSLIEKNMPVLDRMHAQVFLLEQAGKIGAHKKFIRLINEGWALKKKLSPDITTPDVDREIDHITSLGGGAKLCGAGMSGYVLAVFPAPVDLSSAFPVTIDYEGTKRIV